MNSSVNMTSIVSPRRAVVPVVVGVLLLAGCTTGTPEHPASTHPVVRSPAANGNRTPVPSSSAASAGSAGSDGTAGMPAQCPPTATTMTTTVSDGAGLANALLHASAGVTIVLTPGVYKGHFTATASGTSTAPITLCGPRSAVLDGGGIKQGYVLHLSGAQWWQVFGFTVQDGQKGVMLDRSEHDVLAGLEVHGIGDEGIHLRNFSSDNLVEGNVVSDTGNLKAKFGEGIYVGTANKNWCAYSDCKVDASDRNVVRDNTISQTTAENIDIKEGTSDGLIEGNHLSGAGMNPSAATAWVNVKGNGWTIEGNVGVQSIRDGFQVHQVYPGWGLNDVFRGNQASVDASGWGYYVQSGSLHAVIACSNLASGAGSGTSNAACQ